VVLGGGFGGIYSALRLGRALRRRTSIGASITLVNKENFFLFTPLLHAVATGGVETRHIAIPLRPLARKYGFTFISAEVRAIDLDHKRVTTDHGDLSYDYLVLATGSETVMPDIPVESQNFFFLKNLYDGLYLRNHIIARLEVADATPAPLPGLLTFVIVGGGATGVQLIAELRDFILHLMDSYPRLNRRDLRFVLVHDEDRLLKDMDHHLSDYALAALLRKEVEVKLGRRVTRVGQHEVELEPDEKIPSQTIVWTGGVTTGPLVAGLRLAKDDAGRLEVTEHLEVLGYPGVFALGDIARVVEPQTKEPLPPRAHFAVRQARTVAGNIVAEIRGRPKRAYSFPGMGQEAVSLGTGTAAVRAGSFRLYGFPARVIWMISYLALMVGLYNRTRVALDWALTLVFGRDTTLLRLK